MLPTFIPKKGMWKEMKYLVNDFMWMQKYFTISRLNKIYP